MKLQLHHNQEPLRNYFFVDCFCFDKIRAALFLHVDTEAQTIDHPLGLLINSEHSRLIWKGAINTK